jgi:tRNA pseudouridine38-40 synthase
LRYFFYISYKGTNYHGWQVQPNANTIQSEVNKALATIFQKNLETIGSGRTDSGVHAKEQVFHCDLEDFPFSTGELIHKMNGLLPHDIVINKILNVKDESHARFNAISRSYEYHIHFIRSPFGTGEHYFTHKKPDFELMKEACKILIGKHDFTSFSKVKTEVSNFFCDISNAEWQYNEENAKFFVTANRFLRGMVKALVGTLLNVGYGTISLEDFQNIMSAKDRSQAGQSVPSQGLYLCNVRYPEEIFKNNNR